MISSRDRFLEELLNEDIGRGDLFEECLDSDFLVKAEIVSKDSGILAGEKYIKRLLELQNIDYIFFKNDGDEIEPSDILLELRGSYLEILKCERAILNMLQHASGIATNVKEYIKELNSSKIALLDTRKSRPLLRVFEKYASKIGGARNHRMGLDDALMLKDTHLAHIDDIQSFIDRARVKIPFTAKIEIECQSVEEFQRVIGFDVDIIMCDNMSLEEIKECVKLREQKGSRALIEVSGNITLENIREYRELGIDAISSGALIHQAKWLDFSLKMR